MALEASIATCGCGRPSNHRGMCSSRWADRGGRGRKPVEVPRPVLKVAHRASPKRRFHEHFGIGKALVLTADNPALREGRTIFPTRVFPAHVQDRLLKSGEHQRKIGSHVVKGQLAGAPIFTLTLEERATCPRTCRQWASCYGNAMPWSVRIAADDVMLDRLAMELRGIADRHPRFLVRLHILGDFYSVAYVSFWRAMLEELPGLHLFGYTARKDCGIGAAIDKLNRGPRCWIRRSDGEPGEFRAVVVDNRAGKRTPRDYAQVARRLRWRRHNDISFRLAERLRAVVRNAVKRGDASRSAKTLVLLGCSVAEFKAHVERQWQPGMSWANWGIRRDCWQLDHIRPISSFDLKDPAQQAACFHFSNYQPLWAPDNARKKDAWNG